MEESLRKVLHSYGLVKENDGLNNRLIERVVKIVLKEFEIKNKFDVDDGPISISETPTASTPGAPSTAAPVNKAQAHFAATIARATKNNPAEGMKKAIKETFEKLDPAIVDTEDVVEEGEEGEGTSLDTMSNDVGAGVEMVLDSGVQIPFTPHRILPSKLNEDSEQRVTQSGVRSIRRTN